MQMTKHPKCAERKRGYREWPIPNSHISLVADRGEWYLEWTLLIPEDSIYIRASIPRHKALRIYRSLRRPWWYRAPRRYS